MEIGNIDWRYIVNLLLDDEYQKFIIDWIVGLIIGLKILNITWSGVYYLVGLLG